MDELLGRFGMIDRANDKVQGFSTGQRKRLALARALLHDPEVLFLDEPTSGLDPAATRDVIGLIGSLATERGRTVVLCTHFLGEAGRLAHRMAVLHHGQLHAYGRPDDLAARAVGRHRRRPRSRRAGGRSNARPARRDRRRARRGNDRVSGVRVRVRDRETMAEVVAVLVAREVPVYGAIPRTPTLEDVYFEIEAKYRAREAENGAVAASSASASTGARFAP